MSEESTASVAPVLIAIAGLVALATAMGIGRFAFTPLLPMMQEHGLTVAQGGWLASANYVGYLSPKIALGSNILLMVLVLLWRPQGLYPMNRQ